MELSTLGLQNRAEWEAKGYKLPKFDREAVTKATKENPRWIHFGTRTEPQYSKGKCSKGKYSRGECRRGERNHRPGTPFPSPSH